MKVEDFVWKAIFSLSATGNVLLQIRLLFWLHLFFAQGRCPLVAMLPNYWIRDYCYNKNSILGVTTQTILTIPVSQQIASSITKEQIFQNVTQLINRPDTIANSLQQIPLSQSPILNSKFVCLPWAYLAKDSSLIPIIFSRRFKSPKHPLPYK